MMLKGGRPFAHDAKDAAARDGDPPAYPPPARLLMVRLAKGEGKGKGHNKRERPS